MVFGWFGLDATAGYPWSPSNPLDRLAWLFAWEIFLYASLEALDPAFTVLNAVYVWFLSLIACYAMLSSRYMLEMSEVMGLCVLLPGQREEVRARCAVV